MYLPANSVRALDRLGLRAPVVERAREIVQQCFLDARGRLLLDADLPAVWGRTGPCLALEREDLHEVMREGIAVRRDMTLAALREDGPRVHADFADGSSDDYDHVLGADGVRSWVRKTEFGGGDPDFLGQVSWRFLVSGFPELSAWTAWLGHGRVFLAIPMTDGLVYCYADLDAMDPHDPSGDMAAMLPKLYADFADPVPSMLAAAVANGRAGVLLADPRGRPGAVGSRQGRAHRGRSARDVPQHGRGRRNGARGRACRRGDDRVRAAARGVRSSTTTARVVRASPDAAARPHAGSPARHQERGTAAVGGTDLPRRLRAAAGRAVGPCALRDQGILAPPAVWWAT